MDNVYDFKTDGIILLELLIMIHADQRAQNKMIIEISKSKGFNPDELLALLNRESKVEIKNLLEHLYARHGKIDLDYLLDTKS